MRIRTILTFVLLVLLLNVSAQNPYLVLTFTAVDNTTNVQLDSIKVMNRTQHCDTLLYWPDTVLLLGSQVGVREADDARTGLQVFQNYPNPVVDQTTISIYIPERDVVDILITDIMGHVLNKSGQILEQGCHSFRYVPFYSGISFFMVSWKGEVSSIRIMSNTSHTNAGGIEYIGHTPAVILQKIAVASQNFNFSFGDTILYIGYHNTLESGILDIPLIHDTSSFQFDGNIPCPGTPTVTYGGQIYNTVQIFSQCWLKENLNVGTMIDVNDDMENNGIIEKYCYNNEPDSCTKYGGLYQWWEIMQYATQQGVQGICPPDWHIPTDEEWKVLEGSVDSQYGIGDPEWDNSDFRGFDAGTNLKTSTGWNAGGNGSDQFGFSGLPGGVRWCGTNGCIFSTLGNYGNWWSSSEYTTYAAWIRSLGYDSPKVHRMPSGKDNGYSLRCLRDY